MIIRAWECKDDCLNHFIEYIKTNYKDYDWDGFDIDDVLYNDNNPAIFWLEKDFVTGDKNFVWCSKAEYCGFGSANHCVP